MFLTIQDQKGEKYIFRVHKTTPWAAPARFTPKSLRRHPRDLPTRWSVRAARASSAPTVEYKWRALAPSIFRASCFGRWVVTHSLADSDFHGHRPAVLSNQHLSWDLMSFHFGTLTRRLVHPTAPVLLTKNGPLGTPIQMWGFTQASPTSHPFKVWE